ncbi:MAG: hypothetical protein WAM30_21105 [Candidatus Dormiibacterota bacterium]
MFAVVRRWLLLLLIFLQAKLAPEPDPEARAARARIQRLESAAAGTDADAPPARAIAPSSFEQGFTRLQTQRDYPGMWDLIAEDAQRAWGGRDRFVESMWRQHDGGWEIVDVRVLGVQVLGEWHDEQRDRQYRGVAQLRCRYQLHHREHGGSDDVEVERQVHLVPDAAGWRTLFYPTD